MSHPKALLRTEMRKVASIAVRSSALNEYYCLTLDRLLNLARRSHGTGL